MHLLYVRHGKNRDYKSKPADLKLQKSKGYPVFLFYFSCLILCYYFSYLNYAAKLNWRFI